MSSEVPWWKQAKAESLERRAAAATAASGVNPGDAFLIVTEGTVTEQVYFKLLRQDLQLSAVHIHVIPGSASHPKHVIQTAADKFNSHAYRAKKGRLSNTEPVKFDHVWAVIDTDVAMREGIWNEIESMASKLGVKLAHSTPCIEFWLLLHFGMTTRADLINGDAAKSAVKEELGCDYSTNEQTAKAVMPRFIPHWPTAVVHGERVRKHHLDASTPIPANPSTEVCALVRSLNDSAPLHQRKIKP